VEVVTILFFLYFGDRIKQRILSSLMSLAIAELGIILIVGSKPFVLPLTIAIPQSNPKGRLAGYYLTQASATTFVAVLSLISSNVAGYTKKTTVSALYLIGYCSLPSYHLLILGIGNLIGPQVFQSKDAPQYRPAEITIIVCWGICLGLMILMRQINIHRNKKKEEITSAPNYSRLENVEFMDFTDCENPGSTTRMIR